MTITTKNLSEATAQQVFDQVATHLLTQRQQSLNPDSECVYRSEGGLKCAAGCLIDDDTYAPDMEMNKWKQLVVAPKEHEALVSALQMLHDFSKPQYWFYELCSLATAMRLKLTEVHKLRHSEDVEAGDPLVWTALVENSLQEAA